MNLLMPDMGLERVTYVSIDVIKKLNIKAILLDVDNTIAAHGSCEPFEGVVDWLHMLKENKIKVLLSSNNFKKRVEPFALKLGLPFISFSLKPFGIGFMRAKNFLREKNENILVVGDQVFTDILGANLVGMKSILLKPQSNEDPLSVRIKRKFEKRIWNKLER